MVSEKVVVNNHNGLHIKPASAFSNIALQYGCAVCLHMRDANVNAKSVLGILSAQVKQGDEIEIICDGENEEKCLKELVEGIKNRFGME